MKPHYGIIQIKYKNGNIGQFQNQTILFDPRDFPKSEEYLKKKILNQTSNFNIPMKIEGKDISKIVATGIEEKFTKANNIKEIIFNLEKINFISITDNISINLGEFLIIIKSKISIKYLRFLENNNFFIENFLPATKLNSFGQPIGGEDSCVNIKRPKETLELIYAEDTNIGEALFFKYQDGYEFIVRHEAYITREKELKKKGFIDNCQTKG